MLTICLGCASYTDRCKYRGGWWEHFPDCYGIRGTTDAKPRPLSSEFTMLRSEWKDAFTRDSWGKVATSVIIINFLLIYASCKCPFLFRNKMNRLRHMPLIKAASRPKSASPAKPIKLHHSAGFTHHSQYCYLKNRLVRNVKTHRFTWFSRKSVMRS